ncbi:MAG: type II secretion system protein GspD [Candidatus Omnitrophica bacterium]|nr:type II secretion system protein GspD [Candidatus Omnitrophota bacterium]
MNPALPETVPLFVLLFALFLHAGTLVWAADEEAEPPEAQETAPAAPSRGMDEPVSLDFKSTDVVDAITYLAQKADLNTSVSKNVSGRVSLSLTGVPVRDVFDIILRSNNLAYAKQGSVYQIMTEDEYKALYGRKFSDLRETRSFRLQYASPEPAFNLLDALKSDIGRLLVDEDSGTVLVMDTPGQLRQMEESLSTLEQGNVLRIFDLKYAKAKDLEERLKDQIELKKLGYVKADERSNQIIVKTLPVRMREVETLIAALDQKTREVLINAKIVKVTLTNRMDTGIDWEAIFNNFKLFGLDKVEDFKNVSSSTVPSALKVALGTSAGDIALGTLVNDGFTFIKYLETLGETKVISTPSILVTDRQEAKIHVGAREAYVTTTTTTGQTTSTTAEEVQFIDVGIQLAVTPTINSDGYVTMKIKPEISSVVRTLRTPSGSDIPIVDTSVAETSVMVKDGVTVIVGGLAKDQKQHTNDQIPLMGRIPVIGELFRQRDKDNERTELVVFITPHVVTGDALVTGKEEAFGGGIKPYRDYVPVLDDSPYPVPLQPVGQDQPLASEAAPSVQLRLRQNLRGHPGTD